MHPRFAKIILKAKSWSSYLISRGSKNYSLNARNINLISQNSYFRQNPTFIAASNFSRRQRKNENGNVSNWKRFEIIIWSNGFHIYISLLWEMIYDIYLIDFSAPKIIVVSKAHAIYMLFIFQVLISLFHTRTATRYSNCLNFVCFFCQIRWSFEMVILYTKPNFQHAVDKFIFWITRVFRILFPLYNIHY